MDKQMKGKKKTKKGKTKKQTIPNEDISEQTKQTAQKIKETEPEFQTKEQQIPINEDITEQQKPQIEMTQPIVQQETGIEQSFAIIQSSAVNQENEMAEKTQMEAQKQHEEVDTNKKDFQFQQEFMDDIILKSEATNQNETESKPSAQTEQQLEQQGLGQSYLTDYEYENDQKNIKNEEIEDNEKQIIVKQGKEIQIKLEPTQTVTLTNQEPPVIEGSIQITSEFNIKTEEKHQLKPEQIAVEQIPNSSQHQGEINLNLFESAEVIPKSVFLTNVEEDKAIQIQENEPQQLQSTSFEPMLTQVTLQTSQTSAKQKEQNDQGNNQSRLSQASEKLNQCRLQIENSQHFHSQFIPQIQDIIENLHPFYFQTQSNAPSNNGCEEDFERSAALLIQAYQLLCQLFFEVRDYQNCLDQTSNIQLLNRNNVDSYLYQYRCYKRLANHAQALQAIEHAYSISNANLSSEQNEGVLRRYNKAMQRKSHEEEEQRKQHDKPHDQDIVPFQRFLFSFATGSAGFAISKFAAKSNNVIAIVIGVAIGIISFIFKK